MSGPLSFSFELQDCPGSNLTGDENSAFLMSNDPDSNFQRWAIQPIFRPDMGQAGFMIVNVGTARALKYAGPNKPLGMGAAVPPAIDALVLWQFTILENSTFWHLTASTDGSQAVDAYGADRCRNGAVIQSHSSGQTNPRQLWRLNPSAPTSG